MTTPKHRTPLRRTSQGSLFAGSRSQQAHSEAPYGLSFLEPAMAELADEAEAMQANVEGLTALHDSLQKFNESFASWLYVMDMNALTVDWPEAPTETSVELSKQRAERRAQAALEEASRAAAAAAEAERERQREREAAAERAAAETSRIEQSNVSSSAPRAVRKRPAKVKLTAKERRERNIEIEKVISSLPLEYRGTDPNLRRSMEAVIESLLDAPNRTVKLPDLIKPPELSQARVTKCLIVLVNRKVISKDSSSGQVLYCWLGV